MWFLSQKCRRKKKVFVEINYKHSNCCRICCKGGVRTKAGNIHSVQTLSFTHAAEDHIDFQYQLYVSTRNEEAASWGWDTAQCDAFFKMQFDLQRRSYKMQYPNAGYQLIWWDQEIIGSFLIVDQEEYLLLADIALLTEYRNQGFGSQVIRHFQQRAGRERKRMKLRVLSSNIAAHRLYERLGFQVVNLHGMHLEMDWLETNELG